MSDLIVIADKAAEALHYGQTRKGNGRPYIEHPRAVMVQMRYELRCDSVTLAAALLHDVIEDCDVTPALLCRFLVEGYHAINTAGGARPIDAAMVAELVWQCTSLDKEFPVLKTLKRAERKEIQRRRLHYVSHQAVLIKIYDRCHNLSDMKGTDIDFQRLYLEESKLLFDEAEVALGVFGSFPDSHVDLALETAQTNIAQAERGSKP